MDFTTQAHEDAYHGLPPGLEFECDHDTSSLTGSTCSSHRSYDSEGLKPDSTRPWRHVVKTEPGTSTDRWDALAPTSTRSSQFTHESRQRKKLMPILTPIRQQGLASRVRDEVRTAIEALVQRSVLTPEDFDFRVRQHLHALHGLRGEEGLREALLAIETATADKNREDIGCMPAYLCTLLREMISDAKHTNAQSKPKPPRKFQKQSLKKYLQYMLRSSAVLALAFVFVSGLLEVAPLIGLAGLGLTELIIPLGLIGAYLLEDNIRATYRHVTAFFRTKKVSSIAHAASAKSVVESHGLQPHSPSE